MLLTDKEPILNVIEKHFGWSEGIEISENNIAFTNHTCKKVSKKIRNMKGIKDEYIFGEEVDAESCSRQTIESRKEQPQNGKKQKSTKCQTPPQNKKTKRKQKNKKPKTKKTKMSDPHKTKNQEVGV